MTELDDFLKILDQESLSSTAVVKKSGLAELLRLYTKSSSKCGPGALELGLSHQLRGSSNRNVFSEFGRPGI